MRLSLNTKTCLLLFTLLLLVFRVSQRGQFYDSRFALLVSNQIVTNGTLTLDGFAPPPLVRGSEEVSQLGNLPYQLVRANDHVYYYFPIGTSILAVPFVVAAHYLGARIVDASGRYHHAVERTLERHLAAALMAALACLFFLMARELLTHHVSLWVAISGALGTQVWSTASRSLWSHTCLILLLGIALLMVLRAERRGTRLHPIILATLASWMYFVRPTAAIPAIGLAVYLALEHRRELLLFLLVGAGWLAGFVLFSTVVHDSLLPPYYLATRLTFESFPEALAGNLISPSRGVLLHVPLIFFVGWLLLRRRSELRFPNLAWVAITCSTVHLIVISGFPNWWGGWGFGPRFMTDVIPWWILLAVLGLDARRARVSQRSADHTPLLVRSERIAFALLLTLSVFIHAVGANASRAQPTPTHLWRWADAPIVQAFASPDRERIPAASELGGRPR